MGDEYPVRTRNRWHVPKWRALERREVIDRLYPMRERIDPKKLHQAVGRPTVEQLLVWKREAGFSDPQCQQAIQTLHGRDYSDRKAMYFKPMPGPKWFMACARITVCPEQLARVDDAFDRHGFKHRDCLWPITSGVTVPADAWVMTALVVFTRGEVNAVRRRMLETPEDTYRRIRNHELPTDAAHFVGMLQSALDARIPPAKFDHGQRISHGSVKALARRRARKAKWGNTLTLRKYAVPRGPSAKDVENPTVLPDRRTLQGRTSHDPRPVPCTIHPVQRATRTKHCRYANDWETVPRGTVQPGGLRLSDGG